MSGHSLLLQLEEHIRDQDLAMLCFEVANRHGFHSLRDIRREVPTLRRNHEGTDIVGYALHLWKNEKLRNGISIARSELSNMMQEVTKASGAFNKDNEIVIEYQSDKDFIRGHL